MKKMSLCGVTVLLWALRLCALSRQGCQGQGETMGIGGAPDSGFAELQTSNPLQNHHFPFQSCTLKERKGGIASQQNHPHFSSSSSESSSKGLFEATETAEARSRVSTRFCLVGAHPETERWDVRLLARLILGNHPIQFKLEKQFV